MIWTRSETLALASQKCSTCYGFGLKEGRSGTQTPCNCVFRTIFRACYARFKQCAAKEKYISRISLEANPGRHRKGVWGFKNEEYIADFCLVARRTLAGNEMAYRLFRYHFLLGSDWKGCLPAMKRHGFLMDRGEFFHEVYRIEQKLGRAFREIEPHALFPLDEYFGRRITNDPVHPIFMIESEAVVAPKNLLRFPIAHAAAAQ